MKKFKKTLCLLLALVMTFSIMSTGVFAASSKADAELTSLSSFASFLEDLFGKDDPLQALIDKLQSGKTVNMDELVSKLQTALSGSDAKALLDKLLSGSASTDLQTAFQEALNNLDTSKLQDLLKGLDSTKLQELLNSLDTSKLKDLLGNLDPTKLQEVLNNLDTSKLKDLLGNLDPTKLQEVLNNLDTSKLKDLLNSLDTSKLKELLGNLDPTKLQEALNNLDTTKLQELLNSLDTTKLQELLGKLDPAKLQEALNNLDVSKLKDLLGNVDTSKLEELLSKLSDNDLLNFFKDLKNKGLSNSDILKYLQDLINGSSSSDFKSRLEAILEKLKALLNGDTDISDDKTPLADAGMLNSTDHNAYVSGYPDGTFRPAGKLTRAEASQMLYNLLTETARTMYSSSSNSFSDISADKWYNIPVSTLTNAGAINGYANGTFRPAQNITRAEFIKIVVAMYGVDTTATCSYTDLPTSNWAYQYIATATKLGWIAGYSDGSCRPGSTMSRAETVTFLNRVLSRSFDTSYTGSLKTFFDVPSGQWYYNNVMEAANGHNYTRSGSAEVWTGTK
jgi:mRNA-degrading endonuclease toxin of MazEF toxin-antitoxin module